MSASTRKGWKRWLVADLTQLVRGRVRPYQNWRELIAEAELSAEARDCVRDVVRRTRLWRLEMADVAQELLSHFTDGREAGRSDAQLLASFGDPVRAARLIRRAKRSQRPVLYRFFVAILKSVGVVALLYAGLALWANSLKPKITVDYHAKLAALAKAEEGEEPAWPHYREALIAMTIDDDYQHPDRELLDARPGDPNWGEALAWLERNRSAIEWIHEGARRSVLGFDLYQWSDFSEEDWKALAPTQEDREGLVQSAMAETEEPLYQFLLPFVSHAKLITKILALEIRAAAERGDGPSMGRSFTSGVVLARGLLDRPFSINALVAQANLLILERALTESLSVSESWFTAETIGMLQKAAVAADPIVHSVDRVMELERWMIEDLVQRTFSSGPFGGGRLTARGVNQLTNHGMGFSLDGEAPDGFDLLLRSPTLVSFSLPVLQFAIINRSRIVGLADELIAEIDCLHGRSYREVTSGVRRIQERIESQGGVRFGLLRNFFDLTRIPEWEARARETHGAFQCLLAMESYRLDNGDFPRSWESMVPAYLSSIPKDPITGDPLLYRVVEGRPVLYSRGWDEDDDGGQGQPWPNPNPPEGDGDWVLVSSRQR